MNARRWVLTSMGALALVGAVSVFWANDPTPESTELAATKDPIPARLRGGETTPSSPTTDESVAPQSNAPALSDPQDDPNLLAGSAPDPRQVLEEARENPHQTPQSLIDFAHQLAGPMERAQKSEKDALPVFAQMETCATDQVGLQPIQARVVCLANAARLAELYPAPLAARYQALARANPALASILETTGL